MKHTLMRTKIHHATVSGGNLTYPGSVTIGKNMIEASGLLPYEMVHINNIANGNHWETYVIPGNDREIILNGAPAHLFKRGELVVIMAFADVLPNEIADFESRVVLVNYQNEVIEIQNKALRELLY